MSRLLTQVAAVFVTPAAGGATALDAPAALGAARGGVDAAAPAEGRLDGLQLEWRPPVEGKWPSPYASDASADDQVGAAGFPSPGDGDMPAAVAVVGAGAEAVALAGALAGELRLRSRARTALLLVWAPAASSPAPTPAWPAARNLAATLAEGHDVAARGRLVHIQLPHDVTAAVAAANRLTTGARFPTVLVLGGPRSEAFDDLLSSRDVLVVLQPAGFPGSLTELAAQQLRRLNDRVEVERPIAGSVRRMLASSGMGRARSLGARLGRCSREPQR